jgi:hypothetical protein
MTEPLKALIMGLGQTIAREQGQAFDLWTQLPSYGSAQVLWDDYASEHVPTITDLLAEVDIVLAALRGEEIHEDIALMWLSFWNEAADVFAERGPEYTAMYTREVELNRIREHFVVRYGCDIKFKKELQKTKCPSN